MSNWIDPLKKSLIASIIFAISLLLLSMYSSHVNLFSPVKVSPNYQTPLTAIVTIAIVFMPQILVTLFWFRSVRGGMASGKLYINEIYLGAKMIFAGTLVSFTSYSVLYLFLTFGLYNYVNIVTNSVYFFSVLLSYLGLFLILMGGIKTGSGYSTMGETEKVEVLRIGGRMFKAGFLIGLLPLMYFNLAIFISSLPFNSLLLNVTGAGFLAVLIGSLLALVGLTKIPQFTLSPYVSQNPYVPYVSQNPPINPVIIPQPPPPPMPSNSPPQSSNSGSSRSSINISVPNSPSQWDPNVWVNRKLHGYLVKEVIGEGGNGYVLKATGPDGKDYAIKVLKIGNGSRADEYFKNLVNETYPLVSISNNPNVVRIYAIYADELIIKNIISGNTSLYLQDPPMIVMELMNGGTLLDLLNNFYYSSYWRKTVYRAIASVAEALVEIHSKGFVHCDIKPHNVFLTFKPKDPADLPNVNFKLGDLGGAVKVGSSVVQLTTGYAPPEAFTDKAKSSFDIFSLGMTLYVLLTGVIYRPDLREMEDASNCYEVNDMNCVMRNVTIAKQKLALWDPNVPAEVKPLLKRMIDPDPLKRPTAREVLQEIRKLI